MPNNYLATTKTRVKKLLSALPNSSIIVFIILISVCLFLSIPNQANANPETGESTVTLTIPDNDNPTTPVLVSPSNNSYVTTGKPTFVWEESTDSNGISKYRLYKNGTTFFDNLPTTSTETVDYIYTYDPIDDEYSLKLKNSLSDGNYTWKVRAYDPNNNFRDSATWSYTIDTQAPSYIVSSIGGVSVNASAQDPGTIPDSPVEIPDNEPLLLGTGEDNSDVDVTLTIPGDPDQFFSFDIDGDGDWSLQLGILPRNVVMTLDFVITDQAGHVSVLNGLEFLIEPIIIVIPPTPSPTATPSASPTPTPSPTATPGPGETPVPTPSPEITPTPSPTPAPVIPSIEVPITPPREAIFEVAQEITERLPAPVQRAIQNIPEGVRQVARDIAPISAAAAAAVVPAASAVAVASQVGGNLSFSVFAKVLQSLGILPIGKPQGIVFNSESYEPIPFAILTIYSEDPNKAKTTDTVVTDVNGVYSGIKLSPGMYRIVVSHQDYIFPAEKTRPAYLQFKDYYLGEVFKVESEKQSQLFLIPGDPKEKEARKSLKTRFRLAMARLARISRNLTIPLFFISGFLAIIFPSKWNTVIFGLYSIMVARKFILSFKKPIIKGLVADQSGQRLANTVIRVINPNTNELVSILTTQKTGDFKVFGPKGVYRVEVNLPGHVWKEAGAMSFSQIDATEKTQDLSIVMQSTQEVYKELFTESK